MAELVALFDSALQFVKNFSGILLPLSALAIAAYGLSLLFSRRSSAVQHARVERRSFVARIADAIGRAFTTNWQLTLLATTAFVLSCASGWTTWDGMRNFTGEPILSFMVTFGIQGVMLIIAWLIGESFAAGMNQRASNGRREPRSRVEPAIGLIVGTLFGISLLVGIATAMGGFDPKSAAAGSASASQLLVGHADKLIYLAIALLLVATLVLNNKSEIAQPYVQSARIMAKNAVLWVMFLCCMATSVFFSFDSLFSAIFPQSERARAADIRAVNQVAGAVADIGALTQRRQAEEAERLFQSDGWKAYETNLAELSKQSQGAEKDIEGYFVQLMENRRRAIAEQQERIATAQSGQAGLVSKKTSLTDELSRLKGERPTLAAELTEKKTELENRAKGVDAKRVEAMAEERGAEGTLKVGKGQVYRQRMGELSQLQDAYKIQEERVRDAQKRLATVDTRVAQIERELAGVDGDIAKLKGEAQTAENRIKAAEQTRDGDKMPKVDPARVRGDFERARAEFRQDPTVERLGAVAAQCAQLSNAMIATPATKERVRNVDCDPKQANEAAGRVFALNAGIENFAKNCAGGDKLPQSGGIDALLTFGRKCLQDSGLPSRDSGEMAAKMSAIDLNRDDKAHRFVVTWNAFQDGNRLAYLALAIAVAIDSLVFMSGLFGANAVRSPLTDLEGRSDLTADQLEGAIDSTLKTTPHPMATLAALLRSMHPIHSDDGFTSEIILDERDPLIDDMRAVLVAGATIGAVRRAGTDRSRYLVSTGLARYFAVAQRKSWPVRTKEADRKELVNVIGVALLPDPQGNAEAVLSELHPISDAPGYAAEVYPFKIIDADRKRLMMSVLGAGATVTGAVQRFKDDGGRYFVSTDVYKTLLMMRAAAIPQFRTVADRGMLAANAQAQVRGPEQPRQLQSSNPPAHVALEPPRSEPPPLPGAQDFEPPAARIVVPQMPVSLPMEPSIGPANDDLPRAATPEPAHVSHGQNTLAAALRSRIRAEVIQLDGLYPWNDREVALAERAGAGSPAEQALQRLSGRAPYLGKLVNDTITDYKGSVRRAFESLREEHEYDVVYLRELNVVSEELTRLMPLLILSPGGPYEQTLSEAIRMLERQYDDSPSLEPSEEVLLQQLRQQRDDLQMVPDTDSNRLRRIADIIERYRERSQPQTQAQWDASDKRTLN